MCRASPAASFAARAQARTFFSAAWHRFSAALDRSASAATRRESCSRAACFRAKRWFYRARAASSLFDWASRRSRANRSAFNCSVLRRRAWSRAVSSSAAPS